MQLMPDTAREQEAKFGLPPGFTSGKGALNVAANVKAGQQYRDGLIDKYTSVTKDPHLGKLIGLAAYNWGPKNVDGWLSNGADPSKLPDETKKYVASIMSGSTRGGAGSGIMAAPPVQRQAAPTIPGAGGAAMQTPARGAPSNGAVNKYLYKG